MDVTSGRPSGRCKDEAESNLPHSRYQTLRRERLRPKEGRGGYLGENEARGLLSALWGFRRQLAGLIVTICVLGEDPGPGMSCCGA